MKKASVLFLALLSLAPCLLALDKSNRLIPIAPINVDVPTIKIGPQGPKVTGQATYTILGAFYSNNAPVYDGNTDYISTARLPGDVLINLSWAAKRQDIDKILELFTPESREAMAARLKDPSIGPQVKEMLFTYSNVELKAFWMESNTVGFCYVKNIPGGVTPLLFSVKQGRAYLSFATASSSLSDKLDLIYANKLEQEIKVSPPSPDQLIELTKTHTNLELFKE